ncbi:alpha/beta fold hydrolase [Yoonia sp.]|uniref:alpha/beta fold hydrolase n=1 Tax=Yoonia sp. TaxID=2212373 RepID=UPI003F6BB37A
MSYVFVIAFGAVALVIAPWAREWLRAPVRAADRQGTEGDFAQLSQGVTHFRWIGPVRGPVAVIIHGLTTPSIGMEPLARGLGGLGYRVLIYDLYGRGLSDAATGVQDRHFFLRQLSDLLADQKTGGNITLVGYSMGGAIATAFATENPERIKRVVMVAGSGIMLNESRLIRFCRSVPILGDWLHGIAGARQIRGAIPARARQPDISHILLAQRQELNRRGFLPAVLSSRRAMLSEVQENEHRSLARKAIPVVAIWAEQDQVIPLTALELLVQWNRTARQHVVKGATHALPYTHSEQVVDAIRIALRE